jgi:hypothetical protein
MTKEKYNLRNHSQNLFNKNNELKSSELKHDQVYEKSSKIRKIVVIKKSKSIKSSSFKQMIRSYVSPVSRIITYGQELQHNRIICCAFNKEIICNNCLSKKLENNINGKTNKNISIKDRLNTFFTMVAVRKSIIQNSFSSNVKIE